MRHSRVLSGSVAGEACRRRLTVGRGRDQQSNQRLGAPATSDELARQPVEKFRVRRPGAGAAEVFAGGNETAAEDVLPDAVDPNAGHQGAGSALRVRQPPRQFQPPTAAAQRRPNRAEKAASSVSARTAGKPGSTA